MTTPCDNCTKCKNPQRCGNVECQVWHQWFVAAWDATCEQMKKFVENPEEYAKEETHGNESNPA